MSGEAHSRAHLGLPGRQQDLVDALAATGKPLVAVVDLRQAAGGAQAGGSRRTRWCLPGMAASGQAGRWPTCCSGPSNPSGKLCASWPRAEGQIPVYYAHKPTGRPAEGAGTTQYDVPFRSTYMDIPNAPLFAFGQGLSYTTFAYRDLKVLTPVVGRDGIAAGRRHAAEQRRAGGGGGRAALRARRGLLGHAAGQGVEGVQAGGLGSPARSERWSSRYRCSRSVATASICAMRSSPAGSRCG